MKKLKAFWAAFVSLCLILSTMVGLGLNAGARSNDGGYNRYRLFHRLGGK